MKSRGDDLTSQYSAESVHGMLRRDGIVILPGLVPPGMLTGMQRSFATALKHQRWNDVAGYEKTERFRHMVQDVLTLDQGFVDVPLLPLVKSVLRDYLGPAYQLCEAKGWLSLPTLKDFHGWHADMWYDQQAVPELQREVKLAIYLTDVSSGAFQYVRGTHGQQHPRVFKSEEVAAFPDDRRVNAVGAAGTGILFDTSGIHRQGAPILEPRHAVFYNYHDPGVPLQAEDVAYNRYHPLLLNAAFLGRLDAEDMRILGFGDQRTFIPAFERGRRHAAFHRAMSRAFDAKLRLEGWIEPFARRLRALVG